ncbi:hypothetical protein BD779DRAFT_330254 [Infundibulicybe gibba]|nr:hypothetical protein BD779DRAFT_330254 [Infundibulicybe gibba]
MRGHLIFNKNRISSYIFCLRCAQYTDLIPVDALIYGHRGVYLRIRWWDRPVSECKVVSRKAQNRALSVVAHKILRCERRYGVAKCHNYWVWIRCLSPLLSCLVARLCFVHSDGMVWFLLPGRLVEFGCFVWSTSPSGRHLTAAHTNQIREESQAEYWNF